MMQNVICQNKKNFEVFNLCGFFLPEIETFFQEI